MLNYHRLLWRVSLAVGAVAIVVWAYKEPIAQGSSNATGEGLARSFMCFGFSAWHLAKAKGRSGGWCITGGLGVLILACLPDRSRELNLPEPETLRSTLRRWTGRA